MPSIRPLFAVRRGRSARRGAPTAAVAALGAVLALTATACGPGDDDAGDGAVGDASASAGASRAGGGGGALPSGLTDALRRHGIDLDPDQETVGSSFPVNFSAPAVPEIPSLTAKGYPAAAPYDGQKLYQCTDRPGRLSAARSAPTMYRIGCPMTGGSSGGGWIGTGADGRPALVSNTSIGPVTNGRPAGPRFGKAAEGVYTAVSRKYARK
ncbi:hypothetical protein GCM10018793_65080 [Streptomyces sulfonofaciens]|uniref:Lipoprotein n=1 Tax=Streptomyces sulfonofaciens TaxID=68272 RepID=A0A919GNE2_9ACTN|nr:hypothetical protein GCM10018793_65080 [Streptomyces sulfonofaciens]